MSCFHSSFYLNSNSPQKTSEEYIFDEEYKTVGQKKKFENDPRYSYFNAITKMKKKMASNQKQVFQKVFSSETKFASPRTKSFYPTLRNQPEVFSVTTSEFPLSKNEFESPKQGKSRVSSNIQNLHFELEKQKKIQVTNEKPRLDDIMAEYKKISRPSRLPENKVHSFHIRKKNHPITLFKNNHTPNLKPQIGGKKKNSYFL